MISGLSSREVTPDFETNSQVQSPPKGGLLSPYRATLGPQRGTQKKILLLLFHMGVFL